jgi:hypothetical protein
VVNFCKDVLGADDIKTINSLSTLAVIYGSLGRSPEAAKLQERVLKVETAKLGKDNYKTLISMDNLAVTYQKRGLLDDAEKLQAQVQRHCGVRGISQQRTHTKRSTRRQNRYYYKCARRVGRPWKKTTLEYSSACLNCPLCT